MAGWLSLWRNRRSFILGRQKEKKTHLVRITEGISLPRLTEVSTDQVLSYPLPSASTTLSLGNSALGGGGDWAVRMWNTSASQLQPATRQDTHTYTQPPALGLLKKKLGRKERMKEEKNHLSKHAHAGGWEWGAGHINIPTSTLQNTRRLSVATGNIPSPKTRKSRLGNLSFRFFFFFNFQNSRHQNIAKIGSV